MPIWFFVFVVVCALWAFGSAIWKIGNGGLYIAGKRQSPLIVVLAAIGMTVVFGLFAAIQLGFIPDHAP